MLFQFLSRIFLEILDHFKDDMFFEKLEQINVSNPTTNCEGHQSCLSAIECNKITTKTVLRELGKQ